MSSIAQRRPRGLRNLSLCLLASLCLAGTALGNPAYTQGYVHLRAGPSSEYPLVVTLPPNVLLDVNGCVDDFSWCDVDWEGNRGWVYGNFLYYDYQSRRVPVLEFGAALGIGIVAFSIGDYWGRYYPSRPWYRRESYWSHRPPPPRHPPGYGPGRPGPGGRPPGWNGPRPGAGRPPITVRPPPGGGRPGNGAGPGHGGGRPGHGASPGHGGGRPGHSAGPGNGGGRPGGGAGPGGGRPGNAGRPAGARPAGDARPGPRPGRD